MRPIETQLELVFDQAGADRLQTDALAHDIHQALTEALSVSRGARPTEEIAREVALRLWTEGWRLV